MRKRLKMTISLAIALGLLAACANRAAPTPASGTVDEECPRKDGTPCR